MERRGELGMHGGEIDLPFLSAFCLSSLSWAAAGLRVRSLDFGIFSRMDRQWGGCYGPNVESYISGSGKNEPFDLKLQIATRSI